VCLELHTHARAHTHTHTQLHIHTLLCAPASPPRPQASAPHATLGGLLAAFDEAWLEYLDQFLVWKGRDAASLEKELVGCA
jgi:hypothetical protein